MSSVHLLVLVHGMWGNPGHLASMARTIKDKTVDSNLHILIATTNSEELTYDGIELGGERVAEEITKQVETLQEEGRKVTHFSITGYSLGGLVSRYVIGILYQRKFFNNVSPVNFNTFATPHLGLPRYPNFFSSLAASLGPKFLSRTGEQFFALDKWSSTGRPLLSVMADPDRVFYKGLVLFPNVRIYANAVNDMTVPYITAAIETDDPFLDHASNGIEVIIDDQYPNLIYSHGFPEDGAPKVPKIVKPRAPLINLGFPYNLMIYLSLPLLLPAVLSLVVVRISMDAHSSRRRIKLLESDESYSSKLIHIAKELEKEMEDQVVELYDRPPTDVEVTSVHSGHSANSTASEKKWWRPCSRASEEHPRWCVCKKKQVQKQEALLREELKLDPVDPEDAEGKTCMWHSWREKRKEQKEKASTPRDASPSSHLSHEASTPDADSKKGSSCSCYRKKTPASNQPILTELQLEMVTSLNKIPNLKKELMFFDTVRNAHAIIVCRDDFKFAQSGSDGALRHWADHFVV